MDDARTRKSLNAFVKLSRGMDRLSQETHIHLTEQGLTVSQFGVLEALLHLGPLCQRDLAEKILKTPGNLTTVIGNLVKDGLVERVRSEADRRLVHIHLTDKGHELISGVFPVHAAGMRAAFSAFSDAELDQLIRLGRKLSTVQQREMNGSEFD